MAGLKTIISLSFVLAIGFLLVILSSTLWRNQYLPLVVVATYVVAPLPNWICGRASSSDDFMDSGSNAVAEFGWFLTAFFVVMGVALPSLLAHSGLIQIPATIMSIVGGLTVYGTIICFGLFFREEQEF